ncbi:glycoprotein antigen BM86-like isoform X1 [Dermacentor andersoni]|uniref:glycoprotein antigen BM86-like isoform X1 n=1 Tax=Dermacentor andersoni TaxID=34620 RepID=UPI002155BEAE|nr:glycoprotein antigen BM86-like isoform X1 [Dermacentor andersoni]
MNNVWPLLLLVLAANLSSTASADETPEDICASAGQLCGIAPCVPLNDNKYFTCHCGDDRYFNATAQRCYHLDACSAMLCHPGKCIDNDGNDVARCNCSGIHGMTEECQVDPAFRDECVKSGGEQSLDRDGRPHCVCPHGTELEDGTCKSIACLFPDFTCKDICNNAKLREDNRCCQNWEAGSCDAHYEEGTFCQPGTIGNGSICTNVCAEDLLGPVCEHGCTYENSSTPDYKCKCEDKDEFAADGRTCQARVECNEEEARSCEESGEICVFKDGEASCECPLGYAVIGGVCSNKCSLKCQPSLSKCIIDSQMETCVCEYPLKWDHAKQQCILDKQFLYITTFEQYQSSITATTYTTRTCAKIGQLIDQAMRNLYGKNLMATRLLKCGEEHEVELSFSEEPAPALLNRIHLCENWDKTSGCFFPPALYIVNGTSSDPQAVDLCDAYLNDTEAVSSGSHMCVSEGAGTYLLQCALGRGAAIIQQGSLKVQQCDEGCRPNPCPQDCLCEPDATTSYKCNCRENTTMAPLKPHHEKASATTTTSVARKPTGHVWASVAIVIGILIPAVIVVIMLMRRKTSYVITPVKKASSKDFQPLPTEEC